MVTTRRSPVLFAAGLIALMGAGCAAASQAATAQEPAQRAKPTTSQVRSDLSACATGQTARNAPLNAPADASVADFARMLHGTWVRRLTIHGVPVETNSFWYFDMSSPEAGQGQALMIDRINQGPDHLASVTGSAYPKPARRATKANFVRQSETEHPPETGLEGPSTIGAYWSVSVMPAPADMASRGHPGVTLALAGDYHGTGDDYPPNGFHFTETGTFYRDGTAYTTLHPWHAPPQATPSTDAAEPPSADTSVDAVVVTGGNVDAAGNVLPAGSKRAARPTLTFVSCQDGVVDRYFKVNSAPPAVEGKSLGAAWESALASGMFQAVPAH